MVSRMMLQVARINDRMMAIVLLVLWMNYGESRRDQLIYISNQLQKTVLL